MHVVRGPQGISSIALGLPDVRVHMVQPCEQDERARWHVRRTVHATEEVTLVRSPLVVADEVGDDGSELAPLVEAASGEDQLRDALTGSDVRNGIVACWAFLEDAAAEAGVPRAPSETATELVVRFLHALDVDPRPVSALAALFQEARFSTHPLTEDHTRRARAALDDILRDVAQAGSAAP